MSDAPQYKRTKVLVDPELQIGVSTYIVGWIYVYFLAFAILANLPAVFAMATADAGDDAFLNAMDQVRAFARFVVLPMGLTFVAMAVHGVWITHRVAGPIVRLKRTMRDLAARKIPGPIGLRKKDFFQDMAQEINLALAALREDSVRRRRLSAAQVEAAKKLVVSLENASFDPRHALALAAAVLDGAEALDRHLAATNDGSETSPVPLPEAERPAAPPATAEIPAAAK